MTLYEFNSKVNLPKLFTGLGVTGYNFVKTPTFGWWAYTADKQQAIHVFDLFSLDEAAKLYRTITLDKPDYMDFKLRFSDMSENKLAGDITRIAGWTSLWKIAREQAQHGNMTYNREQLRVTKVANDLGYAELIETGQVGLINDRVLDRFKWLKIPEEARNKILIPSFCAPNHICSLSYAPIGNLDNTHVLWKEREHGWTGKLGNRLEVDFKAVATTGGFTWDSKADFWLDNVITDVSPQLPPEKILRIWCEAKNAQFLQSPLEQLKTYHKVADVKHHIKDLTYNQVKELETVFNGELISTWKNLREQQITIGKLTFVKKHNQYFMVRQGVTSQFSNFTMEISHIEKDGNDFYRVGHIFCRDTIIPFKLKAESFISHKAFMKALSTVMFEAGVGIPIVATNHQGYLIDVINVFNEDAAVTIKAHS
jgi:hypothetical protein